MRRKSGVESIIELSSGLPWWAGCLLVPSSYGLFAYVLPHFLTERFQAGLLPIFNAAGIVVALICLVGVVIGIFQRAKQKGLFDKQTSIESIRQLTWHQFEELICEAFRREGYIAQLTEGGADGGVDVELRRDGTTQLVQCKHWRTTKVGVGPIRELAGVVATEKASSGIFVCSGRYTEAARRFAEDSGIRLIGEDNLAEFIQLPAKAESVDQFRCPRCSNTLVPRIARKGVNAGKSFLGCSAFPKCRYTADTC